MRVKAAYGFLGLAWVSYLAGVGMFFLKDGGTAHAVARLIRISIVSGMLFTIPAFVLAAHARRAAKWAVGPIAAIVLGALNVAFGLTFLVISTLVGATN